MPYNAHCNAPKVLWGPMGYYDIPRHNYDDV